MAERVLYTDTAPETEDERAVLERVNRLAYWMDDRFRVPFTRRRIGLDGLIGLVPGVGDLATAAISSYIISEAMRHDVPKPVLARMIWNLGVDTVVGAVPLVGDLFDMGWKANRKNAHLLASHLEGRRR